MPKQEPKPAPKSDAIANRQTQAVATTEVPAHLQQYVGDRRGSEKVDNSDLIIPRVGICQSLTPQRQKNRPEYIPGLEEGQFFNTVSGVIYPPTIKVVPLFFAKQRILFKEPIGSGIECQSPNGKTGGRLSPQSCQACAKSQFGPNGEAPECTEFKNLVSLLPETMEIAVISAKSTTLKIMKQWVSEMRAKNMPYFANIYELSTTTETKNNNTYYQLVKKFVGFVPEDVFKQAENFFEGLKDRDIIVDTTGQDEDPAGFDTDSM